MGVRLGVYLELNRDSLILQINNTKISGLEFEYQTNNPICCY